MTSETNDALPGGGFSLPTLVLTDAEFREIRDLVFERFGISLNEQKQSLVHGRLQKVLRQHGFQTFSEYLEYVKSDATGRALSDMVNRISTNHTFFYREKAHFEFFSSRALPDVVKAICKRNSRDLRIWCAGCATGEEAYTLVMLMMEFFGREYSTWDAGLLATDISLQALSTARTGIYPKDRLEQLPHGLQERYFRRCAGGYQVIEALKREITYRRFNLMNEVFPFKKPFQIIFCRNVMIYFDQPTRHRLVKKFFDLLDPGGYFFVGHSETVNRAVVPFDYVMPALFRKPL